MGRLVSKQRKRLKKEVRALDAESSSSGRGRRPPRGPEERQAAALCGGSGRPGFRQAATTLARAAEEIQEILGDHHDSAVTRDLLRELAASAPGTDAFTYGRLHALEQQAGEESRGKFFRTWSSSPPEPLRWK